MVNRFNHNHWHGLLVSEVLAKHQALFTVHLVGCLLVSVGGVVVRTPFFYA